METFSLPLSEIGRRFTWSEIVMMGWRSQEQAYQLRSKRADARDEDWQGKPPVEQGKKKKPRKQYDGHVPENLPDRFFDEEGEVNLSKVTIKDAIKYMHAQGFKIPPGGGAMGA